MTDNTAGAPMTAADARRAQLLATRTATGNLAIIPTDFDQVYRLANFMATANLAVPEVYRDNPGAIAVAIMWGMELGLSAVQSLQGIANIKGRMAVWGDTLHAVCRAHPDYVDLLEEEQKDAAGNTTGWTMTAQRKGKKDIVREFTLRMAHDAGLTAKSGTPWQTFPARMCYWRAKSWALRDQFNDALRGVASAEELRDHVSVEATVEPPPVAPQRTGPRERPPAPPLQDADVETVDHGDVAHVQHQAQTAATVRAATPDLDALAGQPAGDAGAARTDAQPPQAAAAGAASVDLFGAGDLPPVERKPVSEGQQRMLQAYWDTLEGQGGHVQEQELFDHLGDSVHAGNVKRALEWLQQKCAAGAGSRT